MRRILIVTGLVCLLSTSSWAGGFGLFGSYWETSDVDETLGLGGRISFGHGLSFDATFSYYKKSDGPGIDGLGSEYDLQIMPLDLGVRYLFDLDGIFDPYIGGGASYFFLNANNVRTDDEIGYYGQVGFELTLHRNMNLMVEAVYRQASATLEWYGFSQLPEVVDRVDEDLGGFGANVGVIWRF